MSKCSSGKESYATHDLAMLALYHIQSLESDRPKPVRVYYCHECERFHLSSQPKDLKDWLTLIMEKLL